MADDYTSATGQYEDEAFDIAVWNGPEHEWELKDYALATEPEGRDMLARKRLHRQHHRMEADFRLVRVQTTTTVTEIREG
jgi:hypothetical protein